MPDFIPYSEKQEILNPADWENERFLDQDCTTTKVAAETIRAIVLRLLQIDKTGKNFDINNFDFLVSDDDHPNAGFISARRTRNHKNIIMITRGITSLCKTEDELAGVLAHELGHFTYSKIYGENNNSIFQERFSDLHALDLMIAGGYDPAAYSRVCETMRESGGDSFFDVHGSSMARKEDVDAYLTKLHKEQGDFRLSAPTGLYGKLYSVLKQHKDEYRPYFIQMLESNFPEIIKDPYYRPPVNKILDLILSELKNHRLNSTQRIQDMLEYLENYGVAKKAEIQSTQNFLEEIINLHNTDPVVHACLHKYYISSLSEWLKTQFRGGKPFKVFYPIDQDIAKIEELKTTRNPERVKELAVDLYNNGNRVFNVENIMSVFGQPKGFKMPLRAIAKGTTMSTDWLISVSREMDPYTKNALINVIRTIGFDCDYEWITDNEFYGENYSGKIVGIGKKEIEKVRENRKIQKEYKNQHRQFEDFMCAINVLYDFNHGKISAEQANNRLVQYGNRPDRKVAYSMDSIVYWLSYAIDLSDYKKSNPFLNTELQELNNSAAFAEFFIKPFIKTLKTALQQKSPKEADKILLDNPPRGKTWLEYLQDVSSEYIKLRKYATIEISGENQEVKTPGIFHEIGRNLGIQYKEGRQWNVKFGQIVSLVSHIYTEKLNSAYLNFIKAAVNEYVYTGPYGAKMLSSQLHMLNGSRFSGNWYGFSHNEMIEIMRNLMQEPEKSIKNDIIEDYSVFASKDRWSADNLSVINEALDEEIQQKTDLHKIKRLLVAYGMFANNEQELTDILSKPTPTLKTDSRYELETRLKEYLLTYYMRNNQPIQNLYSVLFATRLDRVPIFRDNFASELADYIETHNLMPNDFQNIYDLHALMQELKLFSKEKSTHSKMMDLLIEKMENLPRPLREEYSWKLLSGFYYSDESDLHVLNRKFNNLDLPLARNKLMEIYSDAIAERLGSDNNTYEYFTRIQELLAFINKKHFDGRFRDSTRVGINKVTQGKLYRLISDKIQSQEHVSRLLSNDKNIVVSGENVQGSKKDLLGRGVEELLDQLDMHKDLSIYSIEFLNRKLTSKSISDYRKKCSTYSGYAVVEELIRPSMLENFYNTFWSSGLEVRALIMNKLLNRAFDTLDEKIKYVCDMNFAKDNKYRKDAEMICECVIKSFEPYEQDLILAAIASADENKQEGKNASRSVGDGLRMFFENMGPAWVKFGQLLSYVPDLPSEIRRDLGKLKDRADIPARWDVYTWMHEAMPQDLYNRIERVEDIVGAGSFWMTAIVQLRNDKGEIEKKVIQLLRPSADARADAGFKTIEAAIKNLSKRNDSYKILQNVAVQAHESAKYEVDVVIGNKQYEKAKKLYGNINVSIDGTEYTPHVADWRYYGTGKNGMSYKIMDYAEGATLSRINADDSERRKMALAYFTIEMVNLFKGDVWDIDRHQGQQNFDIISPNKVEINIYDTGAQLPKAPNKKNKVLLANVFVGLMQAIQSGKTIDAYLLKIIKRLDRLQNTFGIDVSYVANVQKGLMALSDIIEYQKEIKDADGNIIQESKSLSAEDLKNAMVAVLQNPTVDKYLDLAIKGRVIASKLKNFEIKELQDMAQGSDLGQNNPVKIDIIDTESDSMSHKFNKASEEIASLDNPEDAILGIPKKYVKLREDTPDIIFDRPQKVA